MCIAGYCINVSFQVVVFPQTIDRSPDCRGQAPFTYVLNGPLNLCRFSAVSDCDNTLKKVIGQ